MNSLRIGNYGQVWQVCLSYHDRRPASYWARNTHTHTLQALENNPICSGCGSPVSLKPDSPGYLRSSTKSRVLLESKSLQDQIFNRTIAVADQDVRDDLFLSGEQAPLAQKGQIELPVLEKRTVAAVCTRCHSLRHHNCIPIAASNFDQSSASEHLRIASHDDDALFINVVDVMDYSLSMLDTERVIAGRPLLHVFNRADVLIKKQRSLPQLRARLLKQLSSKNAGYRSEVFLISALKGWGLNDLISRIRLRRYGTNVYLFGSTNAGKSSLINSFARRTAQQIDAPVASHIPGTTMAPVPLAIEKFGQLFGSKGIIFDLPGIANPGLAECVRTVSLRSVLPHKYINVHMKSLARGQSLILSELVRIDYLEGNENNIRFMTYTHLETHLTSRPDYTLAKASKIRSEDCKPFEIAIDETYGNNSVPSTFDVVLKDMGFVSFSIWRGRARVRVSTPGGLYVRCRSPSLMEEMHD